MDANEDKLCLSRDGKMKLLMCVLLLVFTGCASIVHGPQETIVFTSEPSGANLEVGGNHMTTPANITLPRIGLHIAHFSKAGYEPVKYKLKAGMSKWYFFGNLLLGGFPGWIIDGINGSIGDIRPNNVHVDLVPLDRTTLQAAKVLPTYTLSNLPQQHPKEATKKNVSSAEVEELILKLEELIKEVDSMKENSH